MRWLLVVTMGVTVTAGGCGVGGAVCSPVPVTFRVTVVDDGSRPIRRATVECTHQENGKALQYSTNDQGRVWIPEGTMPDGRVNLTARAGGRRSEPPLVMEWRTDDDGCHQRAKPVELTLIIR